MIEITTTKDIAQLVSLINSAYRGPASRAGWTHEADLVAGDERVNEAMLRQILSQATTVFLVYRHDKSIIACVCMENKTDHFYLGMLSVVPTLQAKGLGKRMMENAEEYVRQHGMHTIKITVISARKELIAWYERRGYVATGVRLAFPEDAGVGKPLQPLEFIEMKKDF